MKHGQRKAQTKQQKLNWIWEFSKRVVLMCTILYVFGFLFSCVVMWVFQYFEPLETFIEQFSDILKTCVFGYFVKAGIENVFKIRNSKQEREVNEDDVVG